MKSRIELLKADVRYWKGQAEKWQRKYEEMKKIRDNLNSQIDGYIEALRRVSGPTTSTPPEHEEEGDPILEAELEDIDRRYEQGLLNGEHADLEQRAAYDRASERQREKDDEATEG